MVSDRTLVVSRETGGGVSQRSLEKAPLPTRAGSGDLDRLKKELDDYYTVIVDLGELESSMIFMTLAAITARVSEMRKNVYRSPSRSFTAFRTQEIDPLLEECDRQFKFFSRAFAALELDAKISTGGGVM